MLTQKETSHEYQVIVTFIDPGKPNGYREQAFNHRDLDAMWRTVNGYRGSPKVKRIRVFTTLAVFEL